MWAEQKDYTAWQTGEWKRWKRTEYTLPILVKRKKLKAVRYGNKLVYTLPGYRKSRAKAEEIEHGLICTKALLRFKMSVKSEYKVISEKFLRSMQFKAIAEWGINFPRSKTMILFEYSTADNFSRRGTMMTKLKRYRDQLGLYEDFFESKPTVLFVFDAQRHQVKNFVRKYSNDSEFYFTDLESFMGVNLGYQFEAPIYLNGGSGSRYPLTEYA